jgi:acyl-CoA dehydrogenase
MSPAGNDTAGLLEATLEKLFSATSHPQARQQAEAVGWAGDCWDALAEAGLAWVGVPEEAGGSGGTVADACTLVHLAGRHAVALPLAECSLVGGWLVAAAGLRLPGGPLAVAVPHRADRLALDPAGRVSGQLHRVPWGAQAAAVVALADSPDGPQVVLLDPAQAAVTPGRNVAGEPRDRLVVDQLPVPAERRRAVADTVGDELAQRGALARALLLAGAMEAAAELTRRYAGERHQFGRPIGSFQAVAQRLVCLSSEAEAATLAAVVAAGRFAAVGVDARFEVAAAKATASRAASEVAAHAHQVHGAIGMTQEYPLHHFTRRLWAWRQEWWSERHAATVAGTEAVAAGADGLWPLVTSGQRAS